MNKELNEAARFLDTALESLLEFSQETLNEMRKLIDNLRKMFLSYYDKEKSKNINEGKEMFF